MIKKLVTFSLIIFFSIITLVFGANLFMTNSGPGIGAANSQKLQGNEVSTNTPPTTFSLQDIAKHSTANDCWIIIDGKVYDVTNFLDQHTAGPEKIIPYCGTDGSVAFNTKGGRGSHSVAAKNILGTFYIGDVK